MNEMSRRSLIKGIFGTIVAGSVPAFLPRLLPESSGTKITYYDHIGAIDGAGLRIYGADNRARAYQDKNGLWRMEFQITATTSDRITIS